MGNLLEETKRAHILIDGYYYLHTNGDLILRSTEPEIEPGGFVVEVWPFFQSRNCAWVILVEALARGAKKDRVQELAEKWSCNDDDAQIFVNQVGLKVFRDGDKWCATFADFTNLQESQAGFGDTALEALADLARQGLMQEVNH